MPVPVGPNPSLTIAALTDRFADESSSREEPKGSGRRPREEAFAARARRPESPSNLKAGYMAVSTTYQSRNLPHDSIDSSATTGSGGEPGHKAEVPVKIYLPRTTEDASR